MTPTTSILKHRMNADQTNLDYPIVSLAGAGRQSWTHLSPDQRRGLASGPLDSVWRTQDLDLLTLNNHYMYVQYIDECKINDANLIL